MPSLGAVDDVAGAAGGDGGDRDLGDGTLGAGWRGGCRGFVGDYRFRLGRGGQGGVEVGEGGEGGGQFDGFVQRDRRGLLELVEVFLLLHQDADHLGQRRDLAVLLADDRQQLEDGEDQERRDAQEHDGEILHVQQVGQPDDPVGPGRPGRGMGARETGTAGRSAP